MTKTIVLAKQQYITTTCGRENLRKRLLNYNDKRHNM